MRVAVLHPAIAPDAPPDEQDTLVEVVAVSEVLAALGHQPAAVPLTLDLAAGAERLRGLAPDVAFNLVESLDGTGRLAHLVPALLDHLRLPYTGASADALYLTSNKILAKRWLARCGLDTPPWATTAAEASRTGLEPPVIVKPLWEDASVGIDDASVVADGERLGPELARRSESGGEWFAEAYVEGREFNVSVLQGPLGPEILPPAEIEFVDFPPGKPRMVNYAAKWIADSFEFRNTPRRFEFPASDASLLARLADLARRAWEGFGLRGYARVDLRVDAEGTPWVLELNGNPCLAPDSGFVAAAAAAGLGYAALVGRILDAAVDR